MPNTLSNFVKDEKERKKGIRVLQEIGNTEKNRKK